MLFSIAWASALWLGAFGQLTPAEVAVKEPSANEATYVTDRQKWRPSHSQLKQDPDVDPHLICEPYGSYEAEIIARAVDSKGVEHVLWKYRKSKSGTHTDVPHHYFIKVTTLLAESVCGASFYPGIDETITDRIELDTARSLTLQQYQYFIREKGGLENFRAEFIESLRVDRSFYPDIPLNFDSVDAWVWEQLGLDVPRDLYSDIINIDDNYKYDDNGPVGF